MKEPFDNNKYLKIQRENILKRIKKFGGKLYLEFGGKLFDDYHASRVLPGFKPNSKLEMLLGLKDQAEIVIVVNANDINSNKVRADIGITYQEDVLRLIDNYKDAGLLVSSIIISFYQELPNIKEFEQKLKNNNISVYKSFRINGYPHNIPLIVSDEGLGQNEYVKTTRPLVVITAPGPGSGKMAACLSQLYHDNKNGIQAGYAKYETFPVWNLPLNHPVNIAYEAATVDLADINMIDPFHLEAYGATAINYNRDVEVFPLLKAIFERIYGKSPYNSPTDMGVNMVGYAITNEAKVIEASKKEIVRRYYETKLKIFLGKLNPDTLDKMEILLNKADAHIEDRKCVQKALETQERSGEPSEAIELKNGKIITGHRSELLGASAALLLNTLKHFAKIDDSIYLLSPAVIKPIQTLKTDMLHKKYARLRAEEILLALSTQASTNPLAELALKQIPKLKGLELHSTTILSEVDKNTLKALGINVTEEPKNYQRKLYFKG